MKIGTAVACAGAGLGLALGGVAVGGAGAPPGVATNAVDVGAGRAVGPAFGAALQTGVARVETVAGPLPGGTGGVSVDAAGRVYVGDFGRMLGSPPDEPTVVFRVFPDGEWDVFAEDLRGSTGSVFDGRGDLLQASIRSGEIHAIDPDGRISSFATEAAAGPVGIALDEEGALFVASCGDASVRTISAGGTSSTLVSDSTLFDCPNGIALDDAGNVYVANFFSGDVVRVTREGEAAVLATLPGGNLGHLVHHEGVLFVVSRGSHQVFRVTLEGDTAVVAGSGAKGHRDGPALEATFTFPNDLDVGPEGRYLYLNEVADTASDGSLLEPMLLRRIRLSP